MKIDTLKYKRRFVIADIHGCKKTLEALISKISLQKDDVLFFLGDYIDRGPDSSGVFDFILNIKESGFNIYTGRGNHEQDFIEVSENYSKKFFKHYSKTILKSDDLLKEKGKVKKRFKKFLVETELYFELEDFFLVHAGFNFKAKDFRKDQTSMLNVRDWEFDLNQTNGKRIVHGHQPTNYKKIIKHIAENHNRIPLDNGCVYVRPHKYYDYEKLGKLCCLELNSMELFCQPNIDFF